MSTAKHPIEALTIPRAAPPFDYGQWVDQQHEAVRASLDSQMRLAGYRSDVAIYALPSHGAEPGSLVVSDQSMPIPARVVRFPAEGTAAMAVPRSALRSLLWTACRSMPICPTGDPA